VLRVGVELTGWIYDSTGKSVSVKLPLLQPTIFYI
jgi:hypothetical protein